MQNERPDNFIWVLSSLIPRMIPLLLTIEAGAGMV